MHLCPAPGCNVKVAGHLLMCKRHWHLVPLTVQRLVWDAWRAGDRDRHLEAVKLAVAAVSQKQAPTRPAPRQPSLAL